jgi:hypothetical protein
MQYSDGTATHVRWNLMPTTNQPSRDQDIHKGAKEDDRPGPKRPAEGARVDKSQG